MSISVLQTFSGFFFLICFQFSLPAQASTRLDDTYVNFWGEKSDLQEKLGTQFQVSHRISVAGDGFQTAYISISPRGRKPIGTAVLFHGFDRDSRYWIASDFLKVSQLLEQGYRVVLPDLMVRGRTKELNFPLDAKHQWNPTEQQQSWLGNVTGIQEARYVFDILKNERAQGRDHGSLILAGHSRGVLVAAYLAYLMGRDNLRAGKKGTRHPWLVKALWSLNGFLLYTTTGLQFALESKHREKILNSFEDLMEVQPLLQQLQDKDIQPGMEKEIKVAAAVEAKIAPLFQSYVSSFEGIGENFFANSVLSGFEQELEEHGKSKYLLRQVYDREVSLTEAMMKGLRTVYRVNVSSSGFQSSITKNIMIPDSVVGIYRQIMKGELPGIQSLHLVQGQQDKIVPLKLSRIVNMSSTSRVHYQFHVFNIGHFGPEEDVVRELFQTETRAPHCRAILH